MSDREFLRAFARHPSAENFRPFLELYLAFVYSAAHSLQHDDARAADVTRAVFFAFAYKARKLPKKTVVAGWLFRMTRLASKKLIQNPRLCATAGQPPLSAPRGGEEGKGAFRVDPETRALWTTLAPNIDEAVDRLPVKVRDAVLLHLLLGWACAETARALHTSEKRAKKRLDHGLKTLNHVFRKRGWSLRAEDLALCRAGEGWGAEPPASLHSEILRLVEEGVGKKPSLSLARHTLRALSWLRWRRRFKVATVAALVFFVLMAGAGLYIASLWRSGHLMAWFITSSAQWQAKSVRGLSQAARPWPNYKTDYAPLIAFCKAQKIPVLASNAPRRYVNIVSRKGQEALLGRKKSVLSGKPRKFIIRVLL